MNRDFGFRQLLRAYCNGIISEAAFEEEVLRSTPRLIDHLRLRQRGIISPIKRQGRSGCPYLS
jgi:hypothetical protein